MNYTGKIAEMLRKPLNQLEEKMMPQMDKSKMGKKLLEHHPIESKVEVQPYGMALKKS
jgi:hypothetical protein